MTDEHRKLFPHMPEEIFDPWIDAKLRVAGWSYPTGASDFIGWNRRHCGFTLSQLSDFRWTHGVYALKQLHFKCVIRAQCLMEFSTTGRHAEFAQVPNTQQRFRASAEFITAHHRIPSSLAGIPKDGFIDILDGFHRLAALFHALNQKMQIPDEIPIWVASHAA